MPGPDSEAVREASGVSVRDSYGFVIGDHTVQINNYGTKTWSYAPAKEPLSDGARVTGSPYRGLGVYEAGDEDLFFGREAAVAEVLDRMARSAAGTGVLVVSGVSGAGKSSLLRAGILPQVQRRGLTGLPLAAVWPRLLFTPTGQPLDELAVRVAALARTDAAVVRAGLAMNPEGFALTARQAAEVQLEGTPGRLLLVIDQFEQLFTQCGDEAQQRAFVTALHAAASGPSSAALVVIGVRADFEARCADYPELVRPVQDRYLLTAMTEPELQLTITEPARRAGTHVDDGLVEHLLDQVRARQGADSRGGPAGAGVLPLLSHALDQTWRNHAGDALTIADYRATGGIEAAVATSAQRAYDALPPARQDTARLVFLRLTATTSDGTDTGTPATRAELEEGEDPADLQAVLDAFVAERLLTVGAQTVELSHEVLLSAWPLLRDSWLAQTRADRLVRTRLRETAGEWAAHDRNPSYLYRGVLLASAQAAAGNAREDPRRYPPLSPDEAAFVQTSGRASRRRTRLLRGVAALLAALVLVLAGVSVAVIRADRETASQRDTATRQRDAAVAGQLAAESETMGATNPARARLYAVAAWRIDPSLVQARYAMQNAALLPMRYAFGGPSAQLLAFNPRDSTFAMNTLSGVWIYSLVSGISVKFIAIPATAAGQVSALAFSPDGKSLAAGTATDGTYLWDTATRQLTTHLQALGAVTSLAFAPDGSLAVGTSGNQNGVAVPGLQLWTASGPASFRLARVAASATRVSSVAFSRDGRLVAAATPAGALILDVSTGRPAGVIATGGSAAPSIAFSPTSTDTLATAGTPGAQLWNVASRRLIATIEPEPAAAGLSLDSVAFSPDGATLAVGTGRAIQLWNLATRSQEGTPIATGDVGPNSAVFSPDGSTLATLSLTSTLLWSTATVTGTPAEVLPGDGSASWVDYDHAGVLAVSSRDGLRIWNTQTGKPAGSPSAQIGGGPVVFSRDGSVFATTAGHEVVLVDAATKSARAISVGGTPATILSLALSPDGKLLAIATRAGIQLWDVSRQRSLATLTLPGTALSVAFSPDGTRLAAVNGALNSLYWWAVPSGRPVPNIFVGVASTVTWSPDGKQVSLGGISQAEQFPLDEHMRVDEPLSTGKVTAEAWSPDGSVLAVGTAAGTELWSMIAGQQIGATLPSPAGVTSLSWSPDGAGLAVGTSGATQVWDLSALRAADTPAAVCAEAGNQELTIYEWPDVAPGIPYLNVCA